MEPQSDVPAVGETPPIDPECLPALAAFREALPGHFTQERYAELREYAAKAAFSDKDLARDGAFAVHEREVPGHPGEGPIPLLVCVPTATDAPFAAIYAIHGGGMTAGTRRNGLAETLLLAEALGVAVVSVEYRLAPEDPYPAGVEDCFAGLAWTVEHGHELGLDPGRIVVYGASGGGAFAACVTLLARDRGLPMVFGQCLICPMLDDRNNTFSTHQMMGVDLWSRVSNEASWDSLLGDRRAAPDVSPHAAAARATDLTGLPPTFIDVGSCETLRDEAVDYANRIWRAGGDAELHVWAGGFHGYTAVAPETAVSRGTLSARLNWFERILARAS